MLRERVRPCSPSVRCSCFDHLQPTKVVEEDPDKKPSRITDAERFLYTGLRRPHQKACTRAVPGFPHRSADENEVGLDVNIHLPGFISISACCNDESKPDSDNEIR